jgi:hypothetical protein
LGNGTRRALGQEKKCDSNSLYIASTLQLEMSLY